jgi:hypothetical protein
VELVSLLAQPSRRRILNIALLPERELLAGWRPHPLGALEGDVAATDGRVIDPLAGQQLSNRP